MLAMMDQCHIRLVQSIRVKMFPVSHNYDQKYAQYICRCVDCCDNFHKHLDKFFKTQTMTF